MWSVLVIAAFTDSAQWTSAFQHKTMFIFKHVFMLETLHIVIFVKRSCTHRHTHAFLYYYLCHFLKHVLTVKLYPEVRRIWQKALGDNTTGECHNNLLNFVVKESLSEICNTGVKKQKKPYMNKWEFSHGELILSEALGHSFPPLFAAAHIMVIISLGLVTLFIYLPLQEAVINPRWKTHGVVSSAKTPCLMKYICLINTSLSSAAFLCSDSERVLQGKSQSIQRYTWPI